MKYFLIDRMIEIFKQTLTRWSMSVVYTKNITHIIKINLQIIKIIQSIQAVQTAREIYYFLFRE